MSEISIDDIPTHTPGHPPLPARPPILDVSMWTEKFCSMAAVLSTRFPEKAPEFFAYLASILRADRNFDDGRWVAYDRCYRREALAQKNLDWSVPNARLYNEAFTGRARVVPRCNYCLQEDHVAQSCPRNPNRPWFGWLPHGPDNRGLGPSRQPPPRGQPPAEPCRRYNAGTCRLAATACRYLHRCLECGGPHPRPQCPRGGSRGAARSRSPIQRQPPPNSYGPPGPYPAPVPPGPR